MSSKIGRINYGTRSGMSIKEAPSTSTGKAFCGNHAVTGVHIYLSETPKPCPAFVRSREHQDVNVKR